MIGSFIVAAAIVGYLTVAAGLLRVAVDWPLAWAGFALWATLGLGLILGGAA